MKFKTSMLAAALATATATATASWKVVGDEEASLAITAFDDGTAIIIGFPVEARCDTAILTFYGDHIRLLRITIDETPFKILTSADLSYHENSTGLALGDTALARIKGGMNMRVETDSWSADVSLKGSSAAITEAWRHCEWSLRYAGRGAEAAPQAQPEQPEQPTVPTQEVPEVSFGRDIMI